MFFIIFLKHILLCYSLLLIFCLLIFIFTHIYFLLIFLYLYFFLLPFIFTYIYFYFHLFVLTFIFTYIYLYSLNYPFTCLCSFHVQLPRPSQCQSAHYSCCQPQLVKVLEAIFILYHGWPSEPLLGLLVCLLPCWGEDKPPGWPRLNTFTPGCSLHFLSHSCHLSSPILVILFDEFILNSPALCSAQDIWWSLIFLMGDDLTSASAFMGKRGVGSD